MRSSTTHIYDLLWRRGNTAALLAACILAGAVLCAQQRMGRTPVGARAPTNPERLSRAGERIDPNTATVASLRRMNGIGPSLAAAIVEYRREHGSPAFVCPADLEKVRRIGPVTVQRISEDLALPHPNP